MVASFAGSISPTIGKMNEESATPERVSASAGKGDEHFREHNRSAIERAAAEAAALEASEDHLRVTSTGCGVVEEAQEMGLSPITRLTVSMYSLAGPL